MTTGAQTNPNGLSHLTPRIGTSRKANPTQFFATPPEATVALMLVEAARISRLGRVIHECACGAGHMARVIESFGFRVIGTDIRRAHIFGHGGVDFLATTKLRAAVIITNPPYAEVAERFVRHAFQLGASFLALLLPTGFFQGSAVNIACFNALPPTRIWPLGFRLDFTGQGKALPTPHAWFVWDWPPDTSRTHRSRDRRRAFARQAALLMPPLPKPDLTASLKPTRIGRGSY